MALNRSLIDLLITAGVPTYEEATQLATNLDGVSWTTQVLDSGKVDENRFLKAIGNFFQVPVVSIDAKTIDRQTLSLLPSRFVFQHHILPIEMREDAVVLATYDLFNSVGRQLASQLLKKPAEWVLVPRGQILRAMKTLYGVGAETFDEILKTNRSYEARPGHRRRDRSERRRSGSVGREVREPDHSRSDRRARDRYSRRAARGRSAHSLPHRRHPARSGGAAAAALAAIGDHLAPQSHGAHGYRGAPSAAGRPHQSAIEHPPTSTSVSRRFRP